MASTPKIISDLDLNVSKQNLLRMIKKLNFKKKKINTELALKFAHIEARLEFARSTVHWTNKWKWGFLVMKKSLTLMELMDTTIFWLIYMTKVIKNNFQRT